MKIHTTEKTAEHLSNGLKRIDHVKTHDEMGRLTAAPLSLLISIAIFSFSGRVDGWTVDALYPYGVSF